MIAKICLAMSMLSVIVAHDDEYFKLGCYEDDPDSRAISGRLLKFAEATVEKCFRMAKRHGFEVFAVEEQTHCYASETAYKTYYKYGRSEYCASGRGGLLAMDVYQLRPTSSFLLIRMHAMRDAMVKQSMRKEEEMETLRKDAQAKEKKIQSLSREIENLKTNVLHQSKDVSDQLKNVSKQIDNDMVSLGRDIGRVDQTIKHTSINMSHKLANLNQKVHKDILSVENDIALVKQSIKGPSRNVSHQLASLNKKVDRVRISIQNDIHRVSQSVESTSQNISHKLNVLQKTHASDVQQLLKNQSKIKNTFTALMNGPFFYPRGTKDRVGFREYPVFGATLLGFSYPSCLNGTGWLHGLSLEQCIKKCNDFYITNRRYKELKFDFTDSACFCCNEIVGHRPDNLFLNYKFD